MKKIFRLTFDDTEHGLRTANEGIKQRYLKNWADVAEKICFGHNLGVGVNYIEGYTIKFFEI